MDVHSSVLLLAGQWRRHCHITIDYPHIRWWGGAISDANPQITEEAGSRMAPVNFARPFVSSKLLQLAQAVGEQHVRQHLLSEARDVFWVFQLHLCWTGQPAGGRCRAHVIALLAGSYCRLFIWFTLCDRLLVIRGSVDDLVALLPEDVQHTAVPQEVTCTKCKKVRLVWISLQQGRHTTSHSLIAFVDELLAEVAVNLQGRHAVMSWQRTVDEVRQL